MTNLLASADIRVNGERPSDIHVHDRRLPVLASRTLGSGSPYMDGSSDCDALDEMCCRAIRAGLEKRFEFDCPMSDISLCASREQAETSQRSPKSWPSASRSEQRLFRSNARSEHAIFLCASSRGRRSAPNAMRKLDWICRDCVYSPVFACWTSAAGSDRLAGYARSPVRLPVVQDHNFAGASPLRATLVSKINVEIQLHTTAKSPSAMIG